MRIPPFNPYIAIFIGVIAVSSTAVIIRMIDGVPSAIIAHYRLLFAILLMTPIVLRKFHHELRSIPLKSWIRLIGSGILFGIHFLFWYESLNHTSVASSVLILTLHPIFIFIGSYFLYQEKFSSGIVISLIIVLFGGSIIGWGDYEFGDVAFYGNVLAIIGTIAFAMYLLIGKETRKNLSLMTNTYIVYGVGFLTVFSYSVMTSQPFVGYDLKNWGLFLALAIIPTFLGHNLFNWALRWIRSSTVTTGIVFEPIVAAILAYLVLKETIHWHQLLGGTIIIFGLFLFIISTSRKNTVTIAKRVNKQWK